MFWHNKIRSRRLSTVAQSASLGDVAKRIASRTTDLVAISIVLVSSLTLGRQVLDWLHAAPPASTAADLAFPAPAWEDERQPLSLEFGDLPMSLTRQVVTGDQKAAVEALVTHCKVAAGNAECPRYPPNDAEQRLFEKIADLTPIVENAEDWRVYVVDERFALVAAVRRFPDGSKETARGADRLVNWRLVCWGIAMPAGENARTLYVFRESAAGSASPTGLPNVPLPSGAHRNLSLRDERGGLVQGFSGSGSAQKWMKFFDDWFTTRGWSKTDKWSTGAEAWSARFSKPSVPQAGRVEIRIAADHNGGLTGLLQIQ